MGSGQALKHATIFKVLVKGLKENWDRVSSRRGGNQESVVPGSASRRQTSQEGGRARGVNCCCKLIKRRVRLRNAHFISNMAPQGTLTRLLSATWKYQKSIIMGQERKWHEKAEAGGWFGSIGGRSCLAVCWASGLPHQDPVLLGVTTRREDVTLHRTVGTLQEPRPGAEGDIARDGVGRELSVAAQSFPASHVSLPEKSLKSTEH